MRKSIRVPQWIPTTVLILLVPLVAYLAFSQIRDTQRQYEQSAQTEAEANLIAYMRQQYGDQYPASGYQWTIERRDAAALMVCYCDKNGYGWWYSVATSADGQYSATKVADTSRGSATP